MSEDVDHSRRRLLTAATVGTGAIGVAFAALPFLASWKPSARAKALGAPVEVDASKLEAGQMLKVVWRGQAVFVVRRVKTTVDQLGNHDAMLADPKSEDSEQPEYIKASGAVRARNPEYWVGLAVCTHLGCSPLGAFEVNNSFQVTGADSRTSFASLASRAAFASLTGLVTRFPPATRMSIPQRRKVE